MCHLLCEKQTWEEGRGEITKGMDCWLTKTDDNKGILMSAMKEAFI